MSWIDGMRHRLRTLFNPTAFDRELDDEIRHHLELGAQGEGSPDAARRHFGNRTYHKEATREATWLGWLDVLHQDARYAWRSLTRTPSFTAMVVVTLALGIGANGALFSFLDRLFVRMPAGVESPGELLRVWADASAGDGRRQMIAMIGYPTLTALREAGGGKADVALYVPGNRYYLGRDRTPPGVLVEYATANLFSVLGVRPALGRFIGTDEDVMGAGINVAVLSHAYWHRVFEGDSGVIGRTISLGLRPFTVIGVAPPAFRGLDTQAADVWIPLAALQGRKQAGKDWWLTRTTYGARAIVRLSPSLDAAAFVARATVAMRRNELAGDPKRFSDSLYSARLGSIIEARGPGNLEQNVVMATRLGGVAAVVLLIAFANVVSLLLARAMGRQREIALRLALGVSRVRLARMLTTETLLLSLTAGAAAILVSAWGGGVLRAMLMPDVVWTDSPADGRVVVFTVAVAVLAGLLAGIVPAVQATDVQLGALRDVSVGHGRRHAAMRSSFIVAQAAFSVVLVVAGVLFVRSFQNVLAVPLGVDSDRLVFATVGFESGEAPPDTLRARALRRVALRLEGRPGVEAVARSSVTPMRGMSYQGAYPDGDSTINFGSEGASAMPVSTGYFRTVGLRLMSGTIFRGDEDTSVPLEVVVNARMARLYWPGRDAIGRCLNLASPSAPCHRVVGVVDQQRRMNVIENEAAQYYVPLGHGASDGFWSATTIIVRTRRDTRQRVVADLRTLLKEEFPLGYPSVRMMSENLAAEYRPWRVGASLFGAFAVLALLVALVGIYSSVAYGVNRRTREFGVRIALGAQARDVVNLVVGEGIRTVAIGVALGVILSMAAGRLLASMLFGVEPTDASAVMLASCTMLLVAGTAAVVPAWRAARVDPMTALRTD